MLALPLCARRLLLPALLVLGLPTLARADAPVPPPPAAGYKNLQVLPKDTSRDALKLVMKNMNKALGVDCGHCHDTGAGDKAMNNDMSIDTDKKKVAREMMEMVKMINSKFPMTMKRVTCWTCHRGKGEPDKTPLK